MKNKKNIVLSLSLSLFIILGLTPAYAQDLLVSQKSSVVSSPDGSDLAATAVSSVTTGPAVTPGSSIDDPISLSCNEQSSSINGTYEKVTGTIQKSDGEKWYHVYLHSTRKALTLISKQGNITATVYDEFSDNAQISEATYGPGKKTTTKLYSDAYGSPKGCYIKLTTDSDSPLSFEMFAGEPEYKTGTLNVTPNGQSILKQYSVSYTNYSSNLIFDLSNASVPDGSIVTQVSSTGGYTYGSGNDSCRILKVKEYRLGTISIMMFKSNGYTCSVDTENESGTVPLKQSWTFYFKGEVTGPYTYSTYAMTPTITYQYTYPYYNDSI